MRGLILCAVALLCNVGLGEASMIPLTQVSANETVLTFTTGFPSTTAPVTYEGVTFDAENPLGTDTPRIGAWRDFSNKFDNISGASLGKALEDSFGQTHLIVVFPVPVEQVSLLLGSGPVTTWEVTAYSDALALGSRQFTMPAAQEAVRAHLNFEENITRIEITEPNGDNGHITLLDDLTFIPVPEPSTLTLLCIGAIGLAVFARRRRAISSAAGT